MFVIIHSGELTETREVFEGERVQLTCPPSGRLTTRWGKVTTTGHQEVWPVGHDVVVEEADEDDQGTYTCTQTVRGVDVNVLTVQLYVLRESGIYQANLKKTPISSTVSKPYCYF